VIVLDTNVVSELMKPAPLRADSVFAWVRARPLTTVFTTTVTLAEVLVGIGLLPEGRRKRSLHAGLERIAATVFPGRLLPFDDAAARLYAELFVVRRKRGLSTKSLDLQILAIAKSRSMAVATRNVADFEGAGIDVFDPWTASRSP
jgi:predicted nucleic acid-binding protein